MMYGNDTEGWSHFESLFARFIRRLVDNNIILCPREVFMLKGIESALSTS